MTPVCSSWLALATSVTKCRLHTRIRKTSNSLWRHLFLNVRQQPSHFSVWLPKVRNNFDVDRWEQSTIYVYQQPDHPLPIYETTHGCLYTYICPSTHIITYECINLSIYALSKASPFISSCNKTFLNIVTTAQLLKKFYTLMEHKNS
jgi:hypothetical protein